MNALQAEPERPSRGLVERLRRMQPESSGWSGYGKVDDRTPEGFSCIPHLVHSSEELFILLERGLFTNNIVSPKGGFFLVR